MPIITVSHKETAPTELLNRLRQRLPDIVSRAVACDEEPYDGRLRPGDVNMRLLSALPDDEALDVLIEVRTKWHESRSDDLQERSDSIKSALGELGLKDFGVWVELVRAAWSQD